MNRVCLSLAFRRTAWAALTLSLCACSALQIDVDVYKGPLVSNVDVQREQLVAMAMSAKPLLFTVRNTLLDEVCTGWDRNDKSPTWDVGRNYRASSVPFDGLPCPQSTAGEKDGTYSLKIDKGRAAKRLNELVTFYEDIVDLRITDKNQPPRKDGRLDEGIDTLASSYARTRDQALAAARRSDAELRKQDAQQAFTRLDHAVVDLAGRMQFLAGNSWLADETTSSDDHLPTYKSLLESIANSIVVVSDDLRARSEFDDQQSKSVAQEKRAATAAFAIDAAGVVRGVEESLADGRTLARRLEAQTADGPAAAKLVEAKKIVLDRKSTLGEATRSAREAQGRLMDWQSLAASGLGTPLADPMAKTADIDTAGLKLDQKAVAKLLATAAKPVSREALRKEVAAYLNNEAGTYTGSTSDVPARSERLRAALRALESIKPGAGASEQPAVPRKQAVEDLKRVIAEYTQAAAVAQQKAQDTADAAAHAVKQAESVATLQEADMKSASKSLSKTFSSAEFDAAISSVKTAKAGVLAQMAAGGGAGDASQVLAALRSAVAAALAQPAKSDGPDGAKVLALLDTLGAPARLSAASDAIKGIDVLDGVISQLRYAVIDAVRRLGTDHAEAKRAQAALEIAQRQREDKIYIRPASAYLRAANPITAAQSDPTTRWQNMLLDQATKSIRSAWEQTVNRARKDALEKVRADIDKANWQNINSIRVNGAGSGNFVVAKDDVGNWYVKAMGSDASSMIKAAKNLALFNMSSAFDANLLRVDELRTAIDDKSTGNAERTGMRTELEGLIGPKSGAGAAAQASTLSLFKKNYDTVSADQLKSLNTRLVANEFVVDIKGRWASILKDSPAKAALDGVFDSEDAAALHAAAVESSTPPAASGTGLAKPPGEAMLNSLRALQSLRTLARTAVNANAELTRSEAGKADAADQKVAASRAGLDASNDAMYAATASLQAAAVGSAAANEAAAQVAGLQEPQKKARDKLIADQKDQSLAQAALAMAKSRQLAAAAAVDTVFKTATAAAVAERLRVVAETETAVKIIGGAAK